MTNRQVGQFGCEPIYGQCQTFLQSSEDCNLPCIKQGTLALLQQTAVDYCLRVFVQPTHAAAHHIWRFLLRKPSASFHSGCFPDCRLCDLPAATSQDLAQTRQLPNGERIFDCSYPALRANTQSYVQKLAVAVRLLFGYDEGGFVAVCLTSLLAHFQSCLQSNGLRFRVFQSKFLSFSSPVGGL